MIIYKKDMNKPVIQGLNKIPQQKFKVNPLDINITKMQFNLLSRCEREVPEHGYFAPVIEKYSSKDATRKLDEVRLICRCDNDKASLKDNRRVIETIVSDKTTKKEHREMIFNGTKNEILEFLKTCELFDACKELIAKNNL